MRKPKRALRSTPKRQESVGLALRQLELRGLIYQDDAGRWFQTRIGRALAAALVTRGRGA